MIDVLNRGDMQSLLHLLQLLAQSLLHCCYRHACVCACHSVHVAGCVVNRTRQVFCTPMQTMSDAADTRVYTCGHTSRRVYIFTHVCALLSFVMSNLFMTCVCITGVF